MTPHDLQKIVFCLAAGMGLGCFHFGGLWISLKHFSGAGRFSLILMVSFLVRSFVTLTGIFVLGRGEWLGVTACLAGILVMRRIFLVKMGKPDDFRAKGSYT